jgi:hypothetical protein
MCTFADDSILKEMFSTIRDHRECERIATDFSWKAHDKLSDDHSDAVTGNV